MKTFVALLRSINVSGHNIIKMADLRQLLSGSILVNVQTYLQSGNIVFQSDNDQPEALEAIICQLIKNHYDYDIKVKVFDKVSFDRSHKNNPFLDREGIDLKMLYYIHLLGVASQNDFESIKNDSRFTEEMYLIEDTIYVNYSNGYGRSKLSGATFEKRLKISVTARNNNTMQNLCQKLEWIGNETD